MAVSSLGKETEQHASHGGWERRDEWFHSLAGGTPSPDAGRAAHPRAWPRVLADRLDAGARRTALEVLADQELERAEVALGQVLEAPPARGKGGFGGVESRDGSQEVLVVLGELQLHGAAQRRVAGQSQRGLAPVAAALDKRAEAEALEPLRHRAPVPPQRPRRRLHVESVLAQAAEDPCVASSIAPRVAHRREPQILRCEDRAVGERDGLAEAVLELPDVAGPVVALERQQRRL